MNKQTPLSHCPTCRSSFMRKADLTTHQGKYHAPAFEKLLRLSRAALTRLTITEQTGLPGILTKSPEITELRAFLDQYAPEEENHD